MTDDDNPYTTSPTDCLISCMGHVDRMDNVIVIWDEADDSIGWETSSPIRDHLIIGLLERVKSRMLREDES